jgi:hypothetical protein
MRVTTDMMTKMMKMKMKVLAGFLFLLMSGTLSFGQTAAVTYQITDPDSQTWNLGAYAIQLVLNGVSVPAGQAFRVDTGAATTNSFSGALSSTGTLSITLTSNNNILPAGTQWRFTNCPAVSSPVCSTTTLTVNSSGSVSTQLSAATIAPRINGGVGAFAYTDTEVAAVANSSYQNTLTAPGIRCYTVGTGWGMCGGGSSVTWPASGDAVLSNGTNSPAGVAPVNGDCLLGSGGAWIAGACGGTTTNLLTMNNGGSGVASGATFNGSAPITLSYNTIGAAPLASPTFTGTPAAPTQAITTNNTDIATTAAVTTALNGSLNPSSTGATTPGSGAFTTITTTGTIQSQGLLTGPAIGTFGPQSNVSCSTSGAVIFSQPFQGDNDKKVMMHFYSCVGTASYTFPTAFLNAPSAFASSTVAASVATSISTTSVTVTGTTTSGTLILEDY